MLDINHITKLSFEYIQAPLLECTQALDSFLNSLKNYKTDSEQRKFSYEDVLDKTLSYNPKIRKIGLFRINDFQTMVITNIENGWPSISKILSNALNCLSYSVTLSNFTKNEYPRNSLTVYDKGIETRHISCMKDTSWVFFQRGEPLELEDTSRYDKKIKKHRLPTEYLIEILDKVGIDFKLFTDLTPLDSKIYKQHLRDS